MTDEPIRWDDPASLEVYNAETGMTGPVAPDRGGDWPDSDGLYWEENTETWYNADGADRWGGKCIIRNKQPAALPPEVEQELADLRQWQADAIAKHPDLAPVDPDLLRAREIAAAAMGDAPAADSIRGGGADHTPLVQAVLTAIKAG